MQTRHTDELNDLQQGSGALWGAKSTPVSIIKITVFGKSNINNTPEIAVDGTLYPSPICYSTYNTPVCIPVLQANKEGRPQQYLSSPRPAIS
jgi:hypothetical protein